MVSVLYNNISIKKGIVIDPRTKLYILVIINLVIINGSNGVVDTVIKLILSFLLFNLFLIAKDTKVALSYIVVYLSSFLVDIFLLDKLSGPPAVLISLISSIGVRWFPCAMMGYYIVKTTNVSEFLGAMNKIGLTDKITIPMSVIFRFFPTVIEEGKSIRDAMRMRGIQMKKIFVQPIGILEYILVPLLISVVKIGDELSVSALTRGLGGSTKRTTVCNIGFEIWDVIFSLIATVLLILFVIV